MVSKEFKWEIVHEDGQQVALLSGPLNENSHLEQLSAQIAGRTVFDLAGIDRINSCGVREWILFMEEVCQAGREHALRRCSPPIVGQLNMICNFKGDSCTVQSVMAPFVCMACGLEREAEIAIAQAVRLPKLTCEQCGQPMEFDEVEERYFLFTKY